MELSLNGARTGGGGGSFTLSEVHGVGNADSAQMRVW